MGTQMGRSEQSERSLISRMGALIHLDKCVRSAEGVCENKALVFVMVGTRHFPRNILQRSDKLWIDFAVKV